ncbi:siderophore-interacting protein [Pilimelia columellifera subsp. columellifera]|uniref:Siderophore-interacting protein n=2 Tax=Pilimelia TaxID=53370 RepID=A0ABN3N1N0_9ACTN
MIRVTLAGPDLAGFQEQAPADHVKLFFPERRGEPPLMPTVGPRGLERDARHVFRDYTVRAYWPADGELDIDFVVHGTGPAATWADNARPGDAVGVLGPRGSVLPPVGLDWYLLGGDETALPALSRWLEWLPAGARAYVFVEVADATEEQSLPTAAAATVTWLRRDRAPAGTNLLAEAVTTFDLPPGDGFAWVAGEAGSLRPIRRHLRERLPKDAFVVDGYWKRGETNFDHHAEQD